MNWMAAQVRTLHRRLLFLEQRAGEEQRLRHQHQRQLQQQHEQCDWNEDMIIHQFLMNISVGGFGHDVDNGEANSGFGKQVHQAHEDASDANNGDFGMKAHEVHEHASVVSNDFCTMSGKNWRKGFGARVREAGEESNGDFDTKAHEVHEHTGEASSDFGTMSRKNSGKGFGTRVHEASEANNGDFGKKAHEVHEQTGEVNSDFGDSSDFGAEAREDTSFNGRIHGTDELDGYSDYCEDDMDDIEHEYYCWYGSLTDEERAKVDEMCI